jgi:hypothetical protein
LLGVEPCAARRFRDNLGTQFNSGKTGKPTLKFSDGRANRTENYGSFNFSISKKAATKLIL